MSETINIASALSYARGILFGTKSSDPTKGETVDVTSGAAHVKIADEAGADFLKDVKKVVDGGDEYKAVAAGQTNSLFGAVGGVGDYLGDILLIPASTSPGAVTIKDGSGGSAITIFAGGASSLADLKPFNVPINKRSLVGGWYITTGANISALVGGIGS